MTELIKNLYERHDEVRTYLLEHGELTFADEVQASFPKVLVLAGASYFETKVRDCIEAFIHETTGGHELAMYFVRSRAIERQYHTYFKWDSNNVNPFWALFGPGFKKWATRQVRDDDALSSGIKDFLELGDLRNRLVHQDYLTFVLDKTSEEILTLIESANGFVERLPGLLSEYPGTEDD